MKLEDFVGKRIYLDENVGPVLVEGIDNGFIITSTEIFDPDTHDRLGKIYEIYSIDFVRTIKILES